LIHVGGEEVLLDDALNLCERAKSCGVRAEIEVWPDMIHVWHMFHPLLPEAAQATRRIVQFVERCAAQH
jgi:acetyl esterase/lipase